MAWLVTKVFRFVASIVQIPGPLLAKVTVLWKLLHLRRGTYDQEIRELHARYGDLIQVGPSEYSVGNSVYFGRCAKLPKVSPPPCYFKSPEMLNMLRVDTDVANIYNYEDAIQGCNQQFVEALTCFAKSQEVIKVVEVVNCYTRDVMFAATTGQPAKLLEWPMVVNKIAAAMKSWKLTPVLRKSYLRFHLSIRRILRLFIPSIKAAIHVLDRVGTNNTNRPSMRQMMRMLIGDSEACIRIMAGTGAERTTELILTAVFLTYKNPQLLQELRAEIELSGIPPLPSIKEFMSAEDKLPLLRALRQESSRLCDSHTRRSYIVPDGGVMIGNKHVPSNSIISLLPSTSPIDLDILNTKISDRLDYDSVPSEEDRGHTHLFGGQSFALPPGCHVAVFNNTFINIIQHATLNPTADSFAFSGASMSFGEVKDNFTTTVSLNTPNPTTTTSSPLRASAPVFKPAQYDAMGDIFGGCAKLMRACAVEYEANGSTKRNTTSADSTENANTETTSSEQVKDGGVSTESIFPATKAAVTDSLITTTTAEPMNDSMTRITDNIVGNTDRGNATLSEAEPTTLAAMDVASTTILNPEADTFSNASTLDSESDISPEDKKYLNRNMGFKTTTQLLRYYPVSQAKFDVHDDIVTWKMRDNQIRSMQYAIDRIWGGRLTVLKGRSGCLTIRLARDQMRQVPVEKTQQVAAWGSFTTVETFSHQNAVKLFHTTLAAKIEALKPANATKPSAPAATVFRLTSGGTTNGKLGGPRKCVDAVETEGNAAEAVDQVPAVKPVVEEPKCIALPPHLKRAKKLAEEAEAAAAAAAANPATVPEEVAGLKEITPEVESYKVETASSISETIASTTDATTASTSLIHTRPVTSAMGLCNRSTDASGSKSINAPSTTHKYVPPHMRRDSSMSPPHSRAQSVVTEPAAVLDINVVPTVTPQWVAARLPRPIL